MNQTSGVFGAILMCIIFSVPLALVYNFFFYKRSGFFSNFILIIVTYLLGFLATLLYYRIVIMNDVEAQINKMSRNTVSYIAKVVFFAFKLVAITIIAITVNPSLITIFENTLGYWFIGLLGLTPFTQKIFSSKIMEPIKNSSDPMEFNYNFLITRMNIFNVSKFINYAKECNNTNNEWQEDEDALPFDFTLNLTTEEDMQQLEDFVYTKYTFGHYIWVYLVSVISMVISITALTM